MTADYARLLDPQIKAFIDATQSHYAHLGTDAPLSAQRAAYDAMCAHMRAPRPDGLSVEDMHLGQVPARRYGKGAATLLYFHGGGFVLGGLDSHDDICAEIAHRTGAQVIAVDYRLAPEHPYPAALDDGRTALNRVCETQTGPVLLVGDSAGGTLAASLAHDTRNTSLPPLAGQLLIYPGLGGDVAQGSYLEHAHAPLLSRAEIAVYEDLLGAPPGAMKPLQDPDKSGLPPTFVITADCDPLRDDGADYVSAISAAGGNATLVNCAGLVHGFLRARHVSAKARHAFDQIIAATTRLLRDAR